MSAEADPPARDGAAVHRASGDGHREGVASAPRPASVPSTPREEADVMASAPFGRRWFLAVAFRSAG